MGVFAVFFAVSIVLPTIRCSTTQCVPNGQTSSNFGKEFIFGILGILSEYYMTQSTTTLDILSESNSTVTLEIPLVGVNRTYNIYNGIVLSIPIDRRIQQAGTYQEQRGIRISSNIDVSLLLTNSFGEEIASYVIYPVSVAGKSYIIASRNASGVEYGSRLMVIGISDNTEVRIDNGTGVRNITLDRLEVYQLQANGYDDLTGTKVTSRMPVTVISGSGASRFDNSHHNHLVAQMVPTDNWEDTYIVPSIGSDGVFIIRILSETTNANVKLTNKTTAITVTPTSTSDYLFTADSVIVTSSTSVGVVQYVTNDNLVAPFMTLVPSMSQYINRHTFFVRSGYSQGLAIIIPVDQTAGLLLDGAVLQSVSNKSIARPFNNFTVFMANVNEGYHTVTHQNNHVKFGLLVYGLSLKIGFYAGINMNVHCKPPSVSESTHITTQSTVVPVTTEKLQQYTNGSMCFDCTDMGHLKVCDTVKKCSTDQVCYVERYQTAASARFKSGCIDYNNCVALQESSAHSSNECVECCQGDFCNNKGCGDTGLPSPSQRGPLCFDCEHDVNLSDCLRVTLCSSTEVCRIEQYKWGDEFHFKRGCGSVLCSPSSRTANHIFVRSTPVCEACCDTDFCNTNCTNQSGVFPGLIG